MREFVNIFFIILGFVASIYVFTVGILLFIRNLKKIFHRTAYCALSTLLPIFVFELSLLVGNTSIKVYFWLAIVLLIFIIASVVIFVVANILDIQRQRKNK